MNSDYYYSSDSYSDEKSTSPCFSKKSIPILPKVPNVKRRPLPVVSKKIFSGKLSLKKPPIRNILNSSLSKKKILIPINSESSSYYEYDYDSENEDDIPTQSAISRPKQSNKQVLKQINNKQTSNKPNDSIIKKSPKKSSHTEQQTKQPIIIQYEDDDLYQDEELNDSFTLTNMSDIFEYEPEYQDTNEEPEFKISGYTSILTKLIQKSSQLYDENFDSANISSDEKLTFKINCIKSQIFNYTFEFLCNDHCLMTAFSSNIRKSIDFKVPELSEQNDIVIGTMFISKNKHRFNLNCDGIEILSADLMNIKEPFEYDNFLTFNLKSSNEDKNDLVLKSLVSNPSKKIPNISNQEDILINNDNQKLIVIKKIGEYKLEVDASPLINDDLKIFAIGVVSWISSH